MDWVFDKKIKVTSRGGDGVGTRLGGWTQVYKGLTFVTVRDAGHMVPADKPSQALEVFRRFLAGKSLPLFKVGCLGTQIFNCSQKGNSCNCRN